MNVSTITFAKFDAILKLEDDMRVNMALEAMGADLATRSRAADRKPQLISALFAAVDALTEDEGKAFAEYRGFAKLAQEMTQATPAVCAK